MKKKLAAALICLSMAAASLDGLRRRYNIYTCSDIGEAAKTETPAAGGEAASGDVKKNYGSHCGRTDYSYKRGTERRCQCSSDTS